MERILLVEDEANFGTVLRDYLQMNGYEVVLARDGEEGLKAFKEQAYHLCILDIMMPKKDGFALARDIRVLNEEIPIIFLTARSMREDVLTGFRAGADDYITKPFDSEELLYRIKAILKRTASNGQSESETELPEEFTFAGIHFNYRLHTITSNDKQEKLSPKESDLLRLLLVRRNDLLSREEALQTLWGDDNYFNARSMDVFISKLRKRFRNNPDVSIENVHGKGFRLIVTA